MYRRVKVPFIRPVCINYKNTRILKCSSTWKENFRYLLLVKIQPKSKTQKAKSWEPETLRLSFNFFWRLLGSVWHSNSFFECQKCVALFNPSHANTRATWRSTLSRSSRSRPCHVTPEIVHQWISTDLALWTLHWTPEGQPVHGSLPHKIVLNFHISSFVCTTCLQIDRNTIVDEQTSSKTSSF